MPQGYRLLRLQWATDKTGENQIATKAQYNVCYTLAFIICSGYIYSDRTTFKNSSNGQKELCAVAHIDIRNSQRT